MSPAATLGWLGRLKGGVLLAATVALAASFLGAQYGAPAMLFALLIGMAFNFLADHPAAGPGVDFAARTLLRLGVALLGLRLTFADVAALGAVPVAGVAALVALTLAAGLGLARLLGRSAGFGLLTGGAVAICGASAALAISAVLPKGQRREEEVLLTVVGVTTLSTVAMVVYPALFTALGLSELASGWLIGATIHDVAQVVGAGYSLGERAGDIATFTKLVRVALLPVVLIAIGLMLRGEAGGGALRLPWFVVAFVALMVLRNSVALPEAVIAAADTASRFLLVTAIAALGVKTALGRVFATGAGGLAMIGAVTLLLLGLGLGFATLAGI